MAKTGKFPASPKDPLSFRERELDAQKSFKRGTVPTTGFKALSDDTAVEKTYGPYGRQRDSGGGNEGNTVKKIGRDLTVPAKSRDHMGEKLPLTKVPRGLYHPVRGEGPPGDSDS